MILAVLMLVSAFAVCIPASAATASETLENAFGKVLWSADFDYEAATARGTATRNLLAAPTNGDSKLNLWSGGGASTGINVSAALTGSALQFVGATFSNYDLTEGADNSFFDLMWGRTENTSYYTEFDFTPNGQEHVVTGIFLYPKGSSGAGLNDAENISGLDEEAIKAKYNADLVGDDGILDSYVNYGVYSLDRGQSFLSMMTTSNSYLELFKVNRKGYIYSPNEGGYGNAYVKTSTNTEDTDYSGFVYNYYVAEYDEKAGQYKWVLKESTKPLTYEVVDTMKEISGKDVNMSFGSACLDDSKAYKIEIGTTYKIRVDISVNGTKVAYTVYIRENHENAPWKKLGVREVTVPDGEGTTPGTDFPYSCRISEGTYTKPNIDNWFFATYPADCTQGHSKPVIQESYSVEGYKGVYKVKCECCGQIYYTYDKLVDTVFDYDFTTMTAAELAEAKSTYKFRGSTFVEGKGLDNVNEAGG